MHFDGFECNRYITCKREIIVTCWDGFMDVFSTNGSDLLQVWQQSLSVSHPDQPGLPTRRNVGATFPKSTQTSADLAESFPQLKRRSLTARGNFADHQLTQSLSSPWQRKGQTRAGINREGGISHEEDKRGQRTRTEGQKVFTLRQKELYSELNPPGFLSPSRPQQEHLKVPPAPGSPSLTRLPPGMFSYSTSHQL